MSDYDEDLWVAECTVCTWQASTATIRRADLKADLHSAHTGHKTEVDQAE